MSTYNEFLAIIHITNRLDIIEFKNQCTEDLLGDMQEASNRKELTQDEFTGLYEMLMF